VFDEVAGSLAVHELRGLDTTRDLMMRAERATHKNPRTNSSTLLGESMASFGSNSSTSHSSDSSQSKTFLGGAGRGDLSASISDHSGLSGMSNSTGYSSLRRRPKKQARSEVKSLQVDPLRGALGLGPGGQHRLLHSQPMSPRSSSPTSFANSFAQSNKETSLHDDIMLNSVIPNDSHNNSHNDYNNNCSGNGDDENLSAEVVLSPAVASLQLGALTDFTEVGGTGGGLFALHFNISFSVSPVGTILLHLLALQSHALRTYAFFPSLCTHRSAAALSSSRLVLVRTRPGVQSLAHIHLGRQRRCFFNLDPSPSRQSMHGRRQRGGGGDDDRPTISIQINSPGFVAESTAAFVPLVDESDAGTGSEPLKQLFRETSLTSDCCDIGGTLLLTTEVDGAINTSLTLIACLLLCVSFDCLSLSLSVSVPAGWMRISSRHQPSHRPY
jgi:hypothetical protein